MPLHYLYAPKDTIHRYNIYILLVVIATRLLQSRVARPVAIGVHTNVSLILQADFRVAVCTCTYAGIQCASRVGYSSV